MNKSLLCCLAVGWLSVSTLYSQRHVLPLNDGWKTYLEQAPQAVYDVHDTIAVTIPHNWDDYYGYRQLTHGNLHGTAVYFKHFDLPEIQKNKRAFIRFEGIGTYATIELNGQNLGRFLGGRVSVTVDVTSALKSGDNFIQLRVEHPEMIMDMPCVCGGCSSEWGFSEGSQPFGLYRPVVMEICDAMRIEPFGVHVWNDDTAEHLYVETTLKNYSSEDKKIVLENTMLDKQGRMVRVMRDTLSITADSTLVCKQSSLLENPRKWQVDDPYLYTLQTQLKPLFEGKKKTSSLDEVLTPFGIRTLSWPVKRNDGDGRFYMNGQAVFLNGTCEYEHLMGGGHAFSSEQIAARVKMIRQAGFNAFRDAHQPHNLEYQRYWDEYGVLFWTQFSAHIWYDTPEFRAHFKEQLRQWVRERRNSPSVVLWGLQNESVLPEDFARECCDIIREMDPTAVHMRAITTCNGGVGTDWNVVQNWSGTYSGKPERYDQELSSPDQLLNGEYGAWRTLDLHQEPAPFQQNGAYTEERFCQLMEMKVRLAEKAKDSVCGQFQWIFNSHDNPGRRQPDEAYRVIDRVGPVNYKGLVTPWEEPVDAYYMYRSQYVSPHSDPMVYIASHTWADRFTAPRKATIEVYSNADSVRLYNDAVDNEYLGTAYRAVEKGQHFVFEDAFIQYNVLRAVAYCSGKEVAHDVVSFRHLPSAPHEEALYTTVEAIEPAKSHQYLYRINCGGDDYTDTYGHVWQGDDTTYSRSWAQSFSGMNPYQASQRVTYDPLKDTRNETLLGHFRYGRHRLSYRFPLADGKYRLELYFVEPWYGTGGAIDAKALRMFDVAVNRQVVLDDLDIWSEVGHDAVLKKVIEVDVRGGELCLTFPEVKVGQAVISAIAIAQKMPRGKSTAKATIVETENFASQTAENTSEKGLWQQFDEDRIARLPVDRLPEDKNTRPKTSYLALNAEITGTYSRVFMKSKEAVQFVADTLARSNTSAVQAITPTSIAFQFSVGLAQVYALRFNYRNLSDQDLMVHLKLISPSGVVLNEADLTFSQNQRGWKALSTSTGSFINAGTYRVILSAEKMDGLCLESLDVQ